MDRMERELGEIRGGNWSIKTMDQFHLEITRCTRNGSHGKPHSVGSKRELSKDGREGGLSILRLINIDFAIQMATR